MEFGWSDEEQGFRDEIRAFMRAQLPPAWFSRVPGEEPYSQVTREFCRALAARGWMVPHWPREYGGSGASAWMFAILTEELWTAGEPRGSQYMNANYIGPAIMNAGTQAQKLEHLPRIAAGDVHWCQGFSEPEAGSDLAAMRTRAVREGDHYVIDGQKIWTSYAMQADYCFLLARTSERGISVFLVPMKSPGVSVVPLPAMLDIHVMHHLRFEGVRVPESCRLGAENAGWKIVRDALADERVGAPRHMRAEHVLQTLVAQARARGAFDDPRLHERADRAIAACRAARLLSYQARQSRAEGALAAPDAYLGRVAIIKAERAVADFAAYLGADEGLEHGSWEDSEFRTTLIAGLGAGSYEVQLNLVARLWLQLPKPGEEEMARGA
ncbi:MAG: acyl-CoA dehydrogenase family protein [Gammaproteobacteria bacterium]